MRSAMIELTGCIASATSSSVDPFCIPSSTELEVMQRAQGPLCGLAGCKDASKKAEAILFPVRDVPRLVVTVVPVGLHLDDVAITLSVFRCRSDPDLHAILHCTGLVRGRAPGALSRQMSHIVASLIEAPGRSALRLLR